MNKLNKKILSPLFFVLSILIVFIVYSFGRSIWFPVYAQVVGTKTLGEAINLYGADARNRFAKAFADKGVQYPPEKLSFIAYKNTQELELWAHQSNQTYHIKTYPITANSGTLGPKLREGDRQIPEGIYKIIGFNPNSAYHLSMKLNYPNAFDLKHAKSEGRTSPGSNIFIHGKAVSIGCLAMGDEAIEELFTMSYDTGKRNLEVIIAPNKPNIAPLKPANESADWVNILYKNITKEINEIYEQNAEINKPLS